MRWKPQEATPPLFLGLSNKELTALFLRSGGKARVNTVAGDGWTPLTYAAVNRRNADAIPLLLAAGAKREQPDGQGRFPLDVALEKENGRAVAYLQAAPGKDAVKP
jgi:ankyrin repeat protein